MRVVVGVAAVSKARMRRLSRIFRGVDEAASVLSFAYNERLPDGRLFLGDIVVCGAKDYDDGEVMRWLEHGFKKLTARAVWLKG